METNLTFLSLLPIQQQVIYSNLSKNLGILTLNWVLNRLKNMKDTITPSKSYNRLSICHMMSNNILLSIDSIKVYEYSMNQYLHQIITLGF